MLPLRVLVDVIAPSTWSADDRANVAGKYYTIVGYCGHDYKLAVGYQPNNDDDEYDVMVNERLCRLHVF